MIKAIILDFGNVIYKTEWNKMNEFFFNKNRFNLLFGDSNDEELIKIYKDSDIGNKDFKKFFLKIKPDLKDIEKIVRDYKESYSKFKVLNKELLEMVRKLKERGVRLFGFTDTKKEHYDANIESGIYDGFEKIFTSFKFRCLKSDKKAFDLLTKELEKLGLFPKECLFRSEEHTSELQSH